MEWQPIETAPKDGAEVLVTIQGGKGHVVTVARYLEEDNGWWELNNDPTDLWGDRIYPTHWMPLPTPPDVQQPGGDNRD